MNEESNNRSNEPLILIKKSNDYAISSTWITSLVWWFKNKSLPVWDVSRVVRLFTENYLFHNFAPHCIFCRIICRCYQLSLFLYRLSNLYCSRTVLFWEIAALHIKGIYRLPKIRTHYNNDLMKYYTVLYL